MGAVPLDTEFEQYWAQLSVVEKQSLLNVAKNYVQLRQESDAPGNLRKKIILKERQDYLDDEGVSYSWEEVKQMALNKEKRHGL